MQVELAQLNYRLPRLTGRGIEMSRLGGGIGTRGPGETKLETDRRRINKRIKKLEDDLENVRAGRGIQRRQRQAVPLATIALVGATGAGKSTLVNLLVRFYEFTSGEIYVDERPIRGYGLRALREDCGEVAALALGPGGAEVEADIAGPVAGRCRRRDDGCRCYRGEIDVTHGLRTPLL